MNKEKRKKLEEIKQYYAPYSEVIRWFIPELEQAWDELTKEKKKGEIKQRAFDRWVPCPDHRDKIKRGYEIQECYVCKNENLKKELEATKKGLGNMKDSLELYKKTEMERLREQIND